MRAAASSHRAASARRLLPSGLALVAALVLLASSRPGAHGSVEVPRRQTPPPPATTAAKAVGVTRSARGPDALDSSSKHQPAVRGVAAGDWTCGAADSRTDDAVAAVEATRASEAGVAVDGAGGSGGAGRASPEVGVRVYVLCVSACTCCRCLCLFHPVSLRKVFCVVAVHTTSSVSCVVSPLRLSLADDQGSV